MVRKRSPQLEEYLETLVRYKEEGKKPKVKDLAGDLNVSAASVSEMLNKLSTKGLVKYERYGEIELTKKGTELGKAVLRKHRLVEKFLVLIGIRKNKIHDEACVLEHVISDDVERALRKVIDKGGEPDLKANDIKRLIDMKKGEKGKIILIEGGKNACKRLTDLGLTPGTIVRLDRASSRAGPVEVCIRSSCLAIGRGLAAKIYVKVGR